MLNAPLRRGLLLLPLAVLTVGCFPLAGVSQTARPLGKGVSSHTTSAMVVTSEDKDDDGSTDRMTLPAVEYAYRIGVTDDLDVGSRVTVLGLGIEAKWRFLHTGPLHLAVAPDLGLMPLGDRAGYWSTLPVIATYDFADNLSLNAGVFLRGARVGSVDSDSPSTYSGRLGGVGGALGLELRGEVFAIRPTLEVAHYETVSDGNVGDFNLFLVNIHFERVSGREKQQLNRIENKLDQVIAK